LPAWPKCANAAPPRQAGLALLYGHAMDGNFDREKNMVRIWACAAIFCVGCNTNSDPSLASKIGQKCEVQFRRDALGMAGALPASPQTGELNGAPVSMVGTLKRVNSDWIVLAGETSESIIAVPTILLLKFQQPQQVAAAKVLSQHFGQETAIARIPPPD